MSKKNNRRELVSALTRLWQSFYSKEAYLKSVSIGDGEALRGVKNSKLEFKFPVTVLCGPNGVGKSTFLSLSVLSFHGSSGPKKKDEQKA